MNQKFTISKTRSSTGADLCIYEMSAGKNAKAIVQINHGMAEHGARYARFANALADAGYHTIAHDHRGHGQTKADDAPLGVFTNNQNTDGLDTVLSDIHHINSLIKTKHNDLPVILFGHSMGSILGFNYALKHPENFQAVALWNAGFDTGPLATLFSVLLKTERMFKGSDVASSIGSKLTFEDWNKKFKPNRTNFDWLSRDEKEVDKYDVDPLCGFPVSVGLWLDILDAVNFGADDANLQSLNKQLPIHLQAGAVDPCTNKGAGVSKLAGGLKTAGFENVAFNLLADTRHESLNEINRDETTENFIKWLDAHFAN